MPEDDAQLFRCFIDFIYGKDTTIPTSGLYDMTVMSRKYQICSLESECVRHLIRLLDIENATGILNFATRYNLNQLEEEAIEFICRNGDEILPNARHISLLDEESLCLLLERSELCIESEMRLFECLIVWGESKSNQTDNKQHNTTTHERIRVSCPMVLYSTIASLLNLIKFEQMTRKEIVEIIEPLNLVPIPMLQKALHRQSSQDVKKEARCYTKMEDDCGQAHKCSTCGIGFSIRSEHDFCADSFFHPGYFCHFRGQWNCCGTGHVLGQGCTGSFHNWTMNKDSMESASVGARRDIPTSNVSNPIEIGFRTI